ncbi:MAG TPA: hypothetical protein VL651_16020, partial [Bacteroidia bacterium]|nr:hypothetical protein [Bacteroidia bacterium]
MKQAATRIILFHLLFFFHTAGHAQVKVKELTPLITFAENPQTHNLHITCDGKNYWTINGGVASRGQICKYTLDGKLLATYPVNIDGRGLSYNKADGKFYASTYLGDIVRFDDITKGKYTTLFAGKMQDGQCTFALSDDGTQFYDFTKGKLLIHDLRSGEVVKTINGF